MNKKQLFKHLRTDVYCRLKPSAVSGIGVFAIRDIPSNTDIFRDTEKASYIPISREELKNFDVAVQQMLDDFFVFEDNQVWVNSRGLHQLDMTYYLNSSDTPNVKYDPEKETFITLREIKKDEEILVDYKTFDPNWELQNKHI